MNMHFFSGFEDEDSTYSKRYDFVYDKLVNERIIFIPDDIDSQSSSAILALFLMLDKKNHEPISVYINSSGGGVESGLAIYDMMQIIESPIKTVCCGEASSFGAVLLAAGSRGMRYATQNSRIMIHQIQVEGGVEGKGTDIAIEAKEIKFLNKRLTEILACHTGQTYRKVYRDCRNDKYMTAQEAKNYGIIDNIILPTKLIPELKMGKREKAAKNSV